MAIFEVPGRVFAGLWHALALAAVGVPEVLLISDVWARLNFADLAFATVSVEFLVRVDAVLSN